MGNKVSLFVLKTWINITKLFSNRIVWASSNLESLSFQTILRNLKPKPMIASIVGSDVPHIIHDDYSIVNRYR